MAELKTQVTDVSAIDFLNTIPEEQRCQDCFTILEMMRTATGAEPKMWGSIIVGFGHFRYADAGGSEHDWFLTGFSPRKANLTLYLMGGFNENQALLECLGKYKLGGGCLYIKKLQDVDREVLQSMIDQSVQRMRSSSIAPESA
jgi:hypothetical protein